MGHLWLIKKEKVQRGGNRGYYVGQKNWNRNGVNGNNGQNPDGKANGNIAGGGFGRGGQVGGGGQDGNHIRVRGERGGPDNNTNTTN